MIRAIIVVLSLFGISSCYYERIDVVHVYIVNKAIVTETLTGGSVNSGVKLSVTSLPIEYMIKQKDYLLFIRTPNHFAGEPYIEFKVESVNNAQKLELQSRMFDFVNNDLGWKYTFFVKDKREGDVRINVIDQDGQLVDSLVVDFKVVVVGSRRVIDAI